MLNGYSSSAVPVRLVAALFAVLVGVALLLPAGCITVVGGDPIPDCLSDDECTGDQVCTGGACVDPTSPECTVDADCADGEVCTDGACVAGAEPECTVDTDCADGEVCTDGACVAGPEPECTVDTDCADGEVCTDGVCVAGPEPDCTMDTDCADGEVCQEGACVEAPKPTVTAEIGYTSPAGVYTVLNDGDDVPLLSSGQGGSHLFITIRGNGFPPPREGVVGVETAQHVYVPELMEVLHDFTQTLPFVPTDDGGFQFERRFVFLDIRPFEIADQEAELTFTLTSFEDPTLSIVVQRTVVLRESVE